MKKILKALKIIAIIIMLIILFIAGTILINSWLKPNEIPSFFGWKPFIVLSGSMETKIFAGDIAVVREVDTDTLKKDDIIAFRSGEIVITHRIIEVIEEDGEIKYITKGDNNNTEDSGYVTQGQVEGKYCFKVSRLGNLAMFTQTPTGMISCLSVPLVLLILMQMVDSKKDRKEMEEKYSREKEMKEEIERLKKENETLASKK